MHVILAPVQLLAAVARSTIAEEVVDCSAVFVALLAAAKSALATRAPLQLQAVAAK
jgi:hypothetical protein